MNPTSASAGHHLAPARFAFRNTIAWLLGLLVAVSLGVATIALGATLASYDQRRHIPDTSCTTPSSWPPDWSSCSIWYPCIERYDVINISVSPGGYASEPAWLFLPTEHSSGSTISFHRWTDSLVESGAGEQCVAADGRRRWRARRIGGRARGILRRRPQLNAVFCRPEVMRA
jgi:hypothetical protein